jgi:glutamate dehydrogenase/leucine dehydrogenase
VIFADPSLPRADKEGLVRAFAVLIGDLGDYIAGPDMGTDETAMAWVHDEIGRSVGLPRELGGIPLDEIGATGFGLAKAIEVAQEFCDVAVAGARVVVQGFGAVGGHTARFLAERGATLVGAADSQGSLSDPDGLPVDELLALKKAGRPLAAAQFGEKLDRDAVIDLECDIWIPAARPDAITMENVDRLRTRLVAQGANIPVRPEAEAALHERGVLSLPDFIANAGGVICAAVEYHDGSEAQALASIEEKVGRNVATVLSRARDNDVPPRVAALELAEQRVRRAMQLGRWHASQML